MNMNDFLMLKFEFALVIFIVLQFLFKIFDLVKGENILKLNLVLLLVISLLQFVPNIYSPSSPDLFGGQMVFTEFIGIEKTFLVFATLLICMTAYHWLKTHEHAPEFFMLLVTSLLGMFLMLSANNILLFYLGLEMATIPVAALANFELNERRSSEAGMKMILSSAFSSGMLLFGISILYGVTGTLQFNYWQEMIRPDALQVLALILVISGFAFKISLVPFHLWTADVYEGSPVAVTSFLSVVSKGAVSFALARFLFTSTIMMQEVWLQILFFLSIITITIGNVFAIRQTNIKRFLAFSTVSQAGYILLALAGDPANANASVVYFILTYIFSNLAALGVVQVVSIYTGKEDISDYKGFYSSHKTLAVVLMIALFSLAGIPPTAGFFGKLFLFTSGVSNASITWLIIAGLNMMVSLYYYMKIVRIMFSENADEKLSPVQSPLVTRAALIVCSGGILLTGFFGSLYDFLHSIVK